MGRGRLRLQQCQRGQPRRGAANHRSGHRWHLSVASQPREAHISGARGFFAAAEMVHQGCTKHTPATEWQLWGAVPALEDHHAVPTPLAMIDDLSCSCHAQAPSNSLQLYATGVLRPIGSALETAVLIQATESILDSGQSPTWPIGAVLLGSPGSSRLRLRRFLALTVQPSLRRFQRGIGLGGFGHSLVR